ncbi:P-loop containing nucleoside triphosphate hydrolase protein [Pilobolus umbonatus]|nr:P-loop containing nucleoside triphosphate hydrolase protein [Pilobolus umbonatus]
MNTFLSGPSCSGKTTVASVLKKLLKRVIVISQDEYFKTDSEIPIDEATGLENWDCPGAIDFKLFGDHIHDVKEHPEVYLKKENNVQNEHISLHHVDLNHLKRVFSPCIRDIESKDVTLIVVEGFMLFTENTIWKHFDRNYFITASKSTLHTRRESRRGYTTIQGFWEDPPGYFDKIVWPEYLKWNASLLNPSKKDDIMKFNTDYNTVEDITHSILKMIQVMT